MDVDAEPADRALAFEERHVLVRLGVLERHAEVEARRLEDIALFRYPEGRDLVVRPRVEHLVVVGGEPLTEVHVVAVGAEVVAAVGLDDDVAVVDRQKDVGIGENHGTRGLVDVA